MVRLGSADLLLACSGDERATEATICFMTIMIDGMFVDPSGLTRHFKTVSGTVI
jgi:hypothetical protein